MISIRNLTIEAGSFAIRDFNLEVNSGEYHMIMGPTGSGKSLILKSICGIIRINDGKISINGRDVTFDEPMNRKVGYVPQNSDLFPHLDVERNLTFALEIAGTSHAQALEEIRHIVEFLGISSLMKRTVTNLSGGERQKVALGRALARRPEVLLLDEPVSALDRSSRREVCDMLREMHAKYKLTTVHVCHNIEEAQALGTRLSVISDGKLAMTGKATDIIEDILKNNRIGISDNVNKK